LPTTGIGLVLLMPVAASHTMELNQEKVFAHVAGESLALVDVETYPVFIGQRADRLDMMAHFSEQMQALTMLSWKAPEGARRFRLLLTESDFLVERMARSSSSQIASGNLRTYGQLCLATHDHLFDCATHRTRDLPRKSPRLKTANPQVMNVQPGVYSISLYSHSPAHELNDEERPADANPDYTVVLRHYGFPAPRVAPVRLGAGFLPSSGHEEVSQAWAEVTSHKAPVLGPSISHCLGRIERKT